MSQVVAVQPFSARSKEEADLNERIADHIEACRQRIPAFVDRNYRWRGAFHLSLQAWGTDILVAPVNVLMGLPNFLLRVLAVLLDLLGARRAGRRLLRAHLGLPTRIQKTLTARLTTELLDLPVDPDDNRGLVHRVVALAAQEPVRIYVQTRNVAADITAGTLVALLGILLFNQFTPGSVSAGSSLARAVAQDQAVSEFSFGEGLGRLYYALFPVDPSPAIIVAALLLAMAVIAVVAAFSGMLHDPIQAWTGIHQRRLNRLLDAIEESTSHGTASGYRPKDTFVGRLYDLLDWIKGLLSF